MAATFKLYGCHRCGSVAVEMALIEAGQSYEMIDINLSTDEQLGAAFRKVNPIGRVPALVLPDGTVLTESAAILLAIADRFPDAGLLPPPGSSERARVLRWLLFISNNIYEAIGRDDYPARYVPDATQAPGVKQRALDDLRRFWKMVEAEVTPAPYAFGTQFTLLDLYIAMVTQWSIGADWLAADCPKLSRIVAAVALRPKTAEIWRRNFAAR